MMAPEIADSDDEGDFPIQPLDNYRIPAEYDTDRVVAEVAEMAEPDPVLSIDFDTYCSPTQHLSDFDVEQYNTAQHDSGPESSHLLDSSANRFLNEVAPITSSYEAAANTGATTALNMGGKSAAMKAGHKRTRSQFDETQDKTAKKKAKTYEPMNTSSGNSNATQDLATFNYGVGMNSSDMISVEPRTQYTPDTISLLSPSDGVHGKGRNTPISTYSGPQGFTRTGSFQNLQGGIASRSSMGNYQSYTLDRSALDGNFNEINPFGQPSQTDGGDDDAALAKIFNSRGNASRQSTSQDAVDGIMLEMQTSPLKSNPTAAPEQLTAHSELPPASPPFSPITNPDENSSLEAAMPTETLDDMIEMQPAEAISVPLEAQTAPKKRGRKPKQKNNESTKTVEHEEANELHMDDQQIRRHRAGTVDSVSNVSEISNATSASKTGRKKRSKKNPEPVPEELSKKLPSSDLGLDSKAVIGLSPERYVPRPSRRRGRAEPDPIRETGADDSIDADLESVQPETSKAKKPRKGRGKQKPIITDETSSARGNQEVIVVDDEGEEEKAIVDESAKQLKSPPVDAEGEDAEDEMPKSAGRRAKITVDVPVLPKPYEEAILPSAVPEPKKRGRKKKKQVEISANEPVAPTTEEEIRPALAEMDSNIQPKKSSTSRSVLEAELSLKIDEEEEDSEHVKPVMPETPNNNMPSTSPNPKLVHSDFKPLSATPFFNTKGRVGLSKRFSIPSLLRKVDRNKEAPKAIERKEKLNKRQLEEREAERIAKEEAEAEGREYVPLDQLRGKDGRLIEWDF